MTRPARLPAWTHEPLIACVGGPLADQWFTAADWAERLENATRRYRLGRRRSPELDYRPTGTTTHPHYRHVTGRTLRYTPAATQPARKDAA